MPSCRQSCSSGGSDLLCIHCPLIQGLSSLLPAVPAVVFAGGAKLGPKEQAYVAAVKRLNEAAAAKQPINAVSTFGAACEQYEDKQPTTLMSSCWKLLGDILSKAQARGLSPADQPQLYIEALIQVSLAWSRGCDHCSVFACCACCLSRLGSCVQRA